MAKEKNKLSPTNCGLLQQALNYEGKHDPNSPQLLAVVIDEYSMVSSSQLYWIHRRLQEAVGNEDNAFGGVPIALFGDPGQLAPVGGSALWRTRGEKGSRLGDLAKIGHNLYMNIQTVMELNVVRRQSGEYRENLMRLRDGLVTEQDWKDFWNKYCSTDNMHRDRVKEFEDDDDTLFIYARNDSCRERNTMKLNELGEPIMRINAEHDSVPNAKSPSKSAEACGDLTRTLCIARRAKIMLRKNIATRLGLVNGSVGYVQEIIYEKEDDPSRFTLPIAVIVEFKSYTGLPFFKGEGREQWVPILPLVHYIDRSKGTYRRQFPICLAYAITGHKSQGMTIKGKAFIDIGTREASSGLLYVMCSRTTNINNLCLGKARTFDRWSKSLNTKTLTIRLKEDARLKTCAATSRKLFKLELDTDTEVTNEAGEVDIVI